MAFEPFNETLETWIKRFQKLVFEVVLEILCQITKGLGHYHSSKLIHGNLTADQVVIFDNGNSITAKVAKFTFDGKLRFEAHFGFESFCPTYKYLPF